ncbi:MAG TPA: hypothetical protein VI504_11885 [Candidatus Eisenbacteria bacterium]|jgi:hypothetical protein
MDIRKLNTPNRANARESLETRQERLLEQAASRRRIALGAWVAAAAVAVVTTVTLVAGCGGGSDSTQAASYPHETAPAPQQNVVAASDGGQVASGNLPIAQPTSVATDENSVPPDAVVAVSDTFVTAGQPIEVKVEGTPDVTEMALSDGHVDALPMVRDSTGNVWRVNYRVPLRPRANRLGLAVTAKNDAHRWRRVWLFLQVNDGKQQVEGETPEQTSPGQK